MDEEFLVKYPRTVQGLLRAHLRATRFIKEQPERASRIGVKYTGMDLETVKLAMKGITYEYLPNVDGQLFYVNFLKEIGIIKIGNPEEFVAKIVDMGPLNVVLKK